ncbi:MAG TPA: histone deacetylase [Thermoanaerobaculia bacterium]|nr:histone deacetylase [Thermoanaerobaculia bacterium]
MSPAPAAGAGPARPGRLSSVLRRGRRKISEILSRTRIDLVYSRRYQLHLSGAAYDPLRGERILGFLDSAGLLGEVHTPEPASFRLLRRVHDDAYLESLNQPGALLKIVGWEIPDDQADRFLEAQRAMVAGTVLAAHLALESEGIAANLGGGFHHAFAGRGERFCALNDLAVAVADLRWHGSEEKILVIDLDLHDGDGTRALFADDPTVHTLSIHNRTNREARPDAVEATLVELSGHAGDVGSIGDGAYLEAVRAHVPAALERFRPDLVFYLAGCDPAADDEIGDWEISAAGLLARDQFVAACVREPAGSGGRVLPLVVLLAGGYGPNAWRYGARFLSALLNRGVALEPPTTEEALVMRYRSLARGYGERELTGEPPATSDVDDWGLTEEDVGAALGGPRRPRRLLGYYSRQGLELALERTGFLDRLRAKGFERPTIDLELDNPAGDTVRIFASPARRERLIELRLRIDRRVAPGLALLRLEWLLLQNPRAQFTEERPRLPGQEHPGLGMLQEAVALLILACDRLQLDGLVFVPAHFHTAIQGRRELRFLEPADEARFRALERILEGVALPAASRALAEGRIVDARTGEPFAWQPAPMVLPVSEALRQRLQGSEYERQVAEAAGRYDLVMKT